MRRRISALGTAAALALFLSGCGLFGGESAGGGEDPQVAAGAETPDEQGSAPPQGEQVIATKKVRHRGSTLRFDVTQLRRAGRLATLSWDVTLEDGESWSPMPKLGSGATDLSVSGVSLVDPVNAKRYLVARNKDGKCVCTSLYGFGGADEPGDTLSFQATFAAPPPTVKKVDVGLAGMGGITDVPIS